jgi:hypothetical protein
MNHLSKASQAANDLQKAREAYNTVLEMGKQLGLER